MKQALKSRAASIAGLFLIAGCSSLPSNEDRMAATVTLAQVDDAVLVAGCQGEPGRGGALSYSKKNDVYVLSVLKGDKVTVTITPNGKDEYQAQHAKLNAHCFPS